VTQLSPPTQPTRPQWRGWNGRHVISVASRYLAYAIVVGAAILKADIQDTRNMLTSIGANIPVGNSDAGSYFSREILSSVDYGVSLHLGCSRCDKMLVIVVQRACMVCEHNCRRCR